MPSREVLDLLHETVDELTHRAIDLKVQVTELRTEHAIRLAELDRVEATLTDVEAKLDQYARGNIT